MPAVIVALQGMDAGESLKRFFLDRQLGLLFGVVYEDQACIRIHPVPHLLHSLLQKEHHAGIVVFSGIERPAVEHIAVGDP